MKVTILNDTSGNHFGCELVMQTYREQLARLDIEIIKTFPVKTKTFDIPKQTDLVIVNGEGSLHKGQHSQLIQIANNYPAVLLNSIWQDNPNYPALKRFKYITVRETRSLNELPSGVRNAEVVPDLTFGSSYLRNYEKPEPTQDIGVTDNVIEKNKSDGYSALHPSDVFVPWLCNHHRIAAGRFHAATTAAVLGIPFSVWPSNSHKMIGLMEDMGVPELHFQDRTSAQLGIPSSVDPNITKYVEDAYPKIKQMFNKLLRVV